MSLKLKEEGYLSNVNKYEETWKKEKAELKLIKEQLAETERQAEHIMAENRVLRKLANVPDGYGFDLVFHFEKNSYFKETELKKSFVMCKQNVIEKCIGTPITWMPGCDVTKTKKKKGKGKKKTMVTVKCESFFNFFETVEAEQKPKKPADDDEDEEGDEDAEQMDEDFDLGTTFRDDLIPLALEYYLGVIEQD